MRSHAHPLPRLRPTTASRFLCALVALLLLITAGACRRAPQPKAEEKTETVARTEFTDRIENFFEHEPLKPGKPSEFLIHLTDLSDGSPVEKADVTLTVRAGGTTPPIQTKARVGKVTGIYVADVTVPHAGVYNIEFQVKNAKLDERMPLTGFKTQ